MSSMTEKDKKRLAKTIRELYLYPYRSKEENILRGGAWMASWIIGIVVQETINMQSLGGAYFIFAASLLLEFIPEKKNSSLATIVHGFFCTLLFIILLNALIISFGSNSKETIVPILLSGFSFCLGWIVFAIMFLCVILSVVEVHKLFYDEKLSTQIEAEEQREIERTQFLNNVNGAPKGGNT